MLVCVEGVFMCVLRGDGGGWGGGGVGLIIHIVFMCVLRGDGGWWW